MTHESPSVSALDSPFEQSASDAAISIFERVNCEETVEHSCSPRRNLCTIRRRWELHIQSPEAPLDLGRLHAFHLIDTCAEVNVARTESPCDFGIAALKDGFVDGQRGLEQIVAGCRKRSACQTRGPQKSQLDLASHLPILLELVSRIPMHEGDVDFEAEPEWLATAE